jgi:8-oxo-dGTP diphosphatase
VLLAKRSAHVQQGNTWAFPGGAVDQGESPLAAAVRELTEEVTGVPRLRIRGCASLTAPCEHGCGWAYTTFVVEADNSQEPGTGRQANVPQVAVAAGESAWETDVVAWIPVDYVTELPLHPSFAQAWPALRQMVEGAS